ncbi:MAG: STAS domain-containing protein [Actinobacteria bacterium]|nr:STAS domain-containing protein [Actinomycetota bacterium]
MIAGDIDMAGGPILEDAMLAREAELTAAGGGDVILDLSDVHFIDSSGLRTLLAATRRAAGRGGSLELRWIGPEIIRLFEITGTMAQFTIASRRD